MLIRAPINRNVFYSTYLKLEHKLLWQQTCLVVDMNTLKLSNNVTKCLTLYCKLFLKFIGTWSLSYLLDYLLDNLAVFY